jgi:hypothetical protein
MTKVSTSGLIVDIEFGSHLISRLEILHFTNLSNHKYMRTMPSNVKTERQLICQALQTSQGLGVRNTMAWQTEANLCE